MNLNDIRRVAKQHNNMTMTSCNIDMVLRNALMIGENYYSLENVCSM